MDEQLTIKQYLYYLIICLSISQQFYNSYVQYSYLFPESPFDPVGSTVNGVINMFPPSPILSQPNDVPRHLLCPPMGFRSSTWNVEHRECVHIIRVPADIVVEIVSVDIGECLDGHGSCVNACAERISCQLSSHILKSAVSFSPLSLACASSISFCMSLASC